MSKLALIEFLQNKYDELLQKIHPSSHKYRFLTERCDDGSPHVEIGENEYFLLQPNAVWNFRAKKSVQKMNCFME
jgi:hypothetical protein